MNVATGINGGGLPSTGQQCIAPFSDRKVGFGGGPNVRPEGRFRGAPFLALHSGPCASASLWSLPFIHRFPESLNLNHPNAGVQERARGGSGVLLHFAQDRVLPRWLLQHRYHPHNSKQARAMLALKTTPLVP